MACSPGSQAGASGDRSSVHPGFVATGIRFPDGAVTHPAEGAGPATGKGTAGLRRPRWEWQGGEVRQEEEAEKKATKITDSRLTIFILQ